jgi:hypothetical protein
MRFDLGEAKEHAFSTRSIHSSSIPLGIPPTNTVFSCSSTVGGKSSLISLAAAPAVFPAIVLWVGNGFCLVTDVPNLMMGALKLILGRFAGGAKPGIPGRAPMFAWCVPGGAPVPGAPTPGGGGIPGAAPGGMPKPGGTPGTPIAPKPGGIPGGIAGRPYWGSTRSQQSAALEIGSRRTTHGLDRGTWLIRSDAKAGMKRAPGSDAKGVGGR